MEILKNEKNLLITKEKNIYRFYSYNSLISEYHETTKKLVLTYLWNFSQTTLKQLKNYINNYTCFNYENKKQFEKEIEKNNNIMIL